MNGKKAKKLRRAILKNKIYEGKFYAKGPDGNILEVSNFLPIKNGDTTSHLPARKIYKIAKKGGLL